MIKSIVKFLFLLAFGLSVYFVTKTHAPNLEDIAGSTAARGVSNSEIAPSDARPMHVTNTQPRPMGLTKGNGNTGGIGEVGGLGPVGNSNANDTKNSPGLYEKN